MSSQMGLHTRISGGFRDADEDLEVMALLEKVLQLPVLDYDDYISATRMVQPADEVSVQQLAEHLLHQLGLSPGRVKAFQHQVGIAAVGAVAALIQRLFCTLELGLQQKKCSEPGQPCNIMVQRARLDKHPLCTCACCLFYRNQTQDGMMQSKTQPFLTTVGLIAGPQCMALSARYRKAVTLAASSGFSCQSSNPKLRMCEA